MKLRDHKTGQIWDVTSVCAKREGYPKVEFNSDFDIYGETSAPIASVSGQLNSNHRRELVLETHSTEINLLRQEIQANSIDIDAQLSVIRGIVLRLDALESQLNHRNP